MKFTHNTKQASLFQLGLMQIEIPHDNELVKMNKEMPWEEMVEIIQDKFSSVTGRNSNSVRMMLGLEIAKRKLGMSDVEIIEQIKVDVSLKLFCGFDNWDHPIPEPSSMTRFRKKLDTETIQMLEEASIKKFIRKAPKRRRHQVIADTTCVEANITHPTDTKLLSKVVEKMTNILEKTRKEGEKLIIRNKRKVKNLIYSFNLKRRKTKREILKMKKKLIREGQKLLRQISKIKPKIKECFEETITTAKEIISQQKQMIEQKTKRIKQRIISFHETDIRPIVRGKDAKNTEFGPKLGINVIAGGLVQSTKIDNENFPDSKMIDASLETHKKTFGRDPTEIIADRGYHSPQNHNHVQEKGIKDGIQYRGKVPKKANLPPKSTQKRMRRQRSVVEAKIGTFKTKYGGAKNKYQNSNAHVWIGLGIIAMNATWIANKV